MYKSWCRFPQLIHAVIIPLISDAKKHILGRGFGFVDEAAASQHEMVRALHGIQWQIGRVDFCQRVVLLAHDAVVFIDVAMAHVPALPAECANKVGFHELICF